MAKVLKADTSSVDTSYVQKGFAPQAELWVTWSVGFTAAALAVWTGANDGSTFSGDFVDLNASPHGATIGIDDEGAGPEWFMAGEAGGPTSTSPTPSGDAFHLFELHWTAAGVIEFYVDGTLALTRSHANTDASGVEIGQNGESPTDAAAIVYVEYVKIGTTRGGSELFADDFEDGTLGAWDSTTGDVSVVDDPLSEGPPPNPGGRVLIAFDDPALEPNPTWTRIDKLDLPGAERVRVASFEIDRGRSYELDKTEAGTASVVINDPDGVFDPTNVTSPLDGKIAPRKQASLQLYDPVAEEWHMVFRGFVDDWDYTVHPSMQFTRLELQLVDAFAVLAAWEVAPGTAGSPPPGDTDPGLVWYPGEQVDDRIRAALGDMGWPAALTSIFSGNVNVVATRYDSPGTNILTILQDAADAEFPGVANVYASREGLVTFHGRQARFNPDNVDYGIHTYKAGDGIAIRDFDPTRAQIRELVFNRGGGKIINAALAVPQTARWANPPLDVSGQLVTDATSIDQNGVCPWSADYLLTESGILTGNDAMAETKLFATYYVDNYKEPRDRVSRLTFKSLGPDDARARTTWKLMTRIDISDLVDLETHHPGGGGFAEQFYTEGLHYVVRPGAPLEEPGGFDIVELTLDVSPRAYYDTNPFTDG